MKIWRRNAVVATVLLFVCVALYLNWSYNRTDDSAELLSDADGENLLGDVSLQISDDELYSAAVDESQIYADNIDGEEPQGSTPAVSSDYFDNVRLSRQKARDTALDLLKDTAESDKMSQEARDSAAAGINVMAQDALKEAKIESLVQAKGFKECVAFINGDGIRLVVTAPTGGMAKSDIAQITEIATAESGLPATKVTITEI